MSIDSTESIGRRVAAENLSNNNSLGDSSTRGSKEAGSESDLSGVAAMVAELFVSNAQGLAFVENKVASSLGSEAELLSTISKYLQDLGGKRIRPLLALSSYALFDSADPDGLGPDSGLVEATAGIELIHMATLLHDDIIDKSMFRRNSESAFSKFGLTPTLLAGDFLLVKAFGMCARLSDFVIQNTERACIELTEGELLEGDLTEGRVVDFPEYRNIIQKKTASLFELSCIVGGHFAGASDKDVELLRTFGREAGVLFQMVDDILDVTASRDLLGKPSGIDLVQKTPTLPNILWLSSGSSEAAEFFANENNEKKDIDKALKTIRTCGVIDESLKEVEKSQSIAMTCLDEINCKPKEAESLKNLLEYTVSRIPSLKE